MSVYRKIDPRMWDDERFVALSPEAKLVWVLILTGPHTMSLPGLSVCGKAGLSEASRYGIDTVSKAVDELSASGMVVFNAAARVVRVPNAPKYNPCSNAKVLTGWRSLWNSVPECAEKYHHVASLRASLDFSQPWVPAAWAHAFGTLSIPYRYRIDRVSISGAGAGAPTGTELSERAELAAGAAVQPAPPLKPKRTPKAPATPEQPPTDPTARAVFDVIIADPVLAAIVARPADLATRMVAPGAYPGVNVLSQVLRAAAFVAGGKRSYRDGRAFLLGWMGRADIEPVAPKGGPHTPAPVDHHDPIEAQRAIYRAQIKVAS